MWISSYRLLSQSFSDYWILKCLKRYEPYLWENEKQSYLRHAVLFGFFVQLNRMYTDTAQKLPTNSESNIMPCSTVPRFKYLPIRLVSLLWLQKLFVAFAEYSEKDLSYKICLFLVNAVLRLCHLEVQIRSRFQLHQMMAPQETHGMHLQMASILKRVS